MKKLGIFGAGGFAREVNWLIEEAGTTPATAFFESDSVWTDRTVQGLPVLPASRIDPAAWEIVIAIGDPGARKKILDSLPSGLGYPTFIHPTVRMGRSVEIGSGVQICAGSILTCDIRVGDQVQLNLMTTVGHDCVLGNFVTTAPAVNISGNCDIGELSYIGTNACLREGLRIPAATVIGMGAVLVSQVSEAGILVGNPARPR